MTTTLGIKNFRSIKDARLELGVFTVLTGENNSGKSSFLYALQVMKNVVSNPNQSVDEFLNLHFLNLGGRKEASHKNRPFSRDGMKANYDFSFSLFNEIEGTEYQINIGNISSLLFKKTSFLHPFDLSLDIIFPYSLNKKITREINILGTTHGYEISWNGFTINNPIKTIFNSTSEIQIQRPPTSTIPIEDETDALFIISMFEEPINTLTSSDVIPTQRGFTKPIYNLIPLQQFIYTEEEVATLLATDKTLQAKVSYYFEKITGKRFTVSMSPGVGFFYLQVREPDSEFSTELVNQGMGINQIVYLLSKILYEKNRLICVDEPEIHLHPTLIEKFMHVLMEIAQNENKRFLFSTHSEHLLLSLLAEVHEGNLNPEDLKVHYLTKEGFETKVETQRVGSNGQIEGGLKTFIESQMQLSQRFFPVGISE